MCFSILYSVGVSLLYSGYSGFHLYGINVHFRKQRTRKVNIRYAHIKDSIQHFLLCTADVEWKKGMEKKGGRKEKRRHFIHLHFNPFFYNSVYGWLVIKKSVTLNIHSSGNNVSIHIFWLGKMGTKLLSSRPTYPCTCTDDSNTYFVCNPFKLHYLLIKEMNTLWYLFVRVHVYVWLVGKKK